MRKIIWVAALLASAMASMGAQAAQWVTIAGQASDPDQDTVEVDTEHVAATGDKRTTAVRVNRSTARASDDGTLYRSLQGPVEFDCAKHTARFTQSQFYAEPLWHTPGLHTQTPPADLLPTALRLIEPDPHERVIQTACAAKVS